jgi:hypothetical protein
MFEHVVIYLQIELRIVIIWEGIILNKGSSFPKIYTSKITDIFEQLGYLI